MSGGVIIIGGGQAGFQVATTLRQKGFSGPITLLAGENTPPYERPPLSKAFLLGERTAAELLLRPPAFYGERNIDLRLGVTASNIDREAGVVTTGEGEILAWDRLVLATGARARRLPAPAGCLAGVHVLRGLEDARALAAELVPGRRLAILGGGYIGLEVASAARLRGLGVVVIEALDRLMARTASPPVAAALMRRHREQGVEFRLGARLAECSGEGGRLVGIRLEDGEGMVADALLVGIGAEPEDALARSAGLAVDGGILVDAAGRTSDPDIFAAGDCTRRRHPLAIEPVRIESVQNAVDQAKAVAAAILGEPASPEPVPWFWSDQYELKLQTAGLFAAGDTAVVRGDPEGPAFSVAHLRAGRLVAVESLGVPRDHVQSRKLIAAGACPDPERLADPDVPLKSLG